MREIKFSYIFQHCDTGRFTDQRYTLQGVEESFATKGSLPCASENGWNLVARREFTGHLDKHGREVFEGDVLRTPHFVSGKTTHYMHHVVEWSEKFAGWFARATVAKHENDGCVQLWVYAKNSPQCEVVGNVHQHPHLLKEN